MTQHIELNYKDPVHQGFFDPIQEMLSSYASENLKLVLATTTSVKVVAGTAEKEVSIAIGGKYRFRTTETTAALPGGATGECPIFVTASANDFTGPVSNPDEKTVYTFGLEIKKTGETPAAALYRQIGIAVVSGGVITGLKQSAGGISGAQIEDAALSSTSGDIEWTREPGGAMVANFKAQNSLGVHTRVEEATRTNTALGSFSTPLICTLPKVKAGQIIDLYLMMYMKKAAGATFAQLLINGSAPAGLTEFANGSTEGKYDLVYLSASGSGTQLFTSVSNVEESLAVGSTAVENGQHQPLIGTWHPFRAYQDATNLTFEMVGKAASGTTKIVNALIAAQVRA